MLYLLKACHFIYIYVRFVMVDNMALLSVPLDVTNRFLWVFLGNVIYGLGSKFNVTWGKGGKRGVYKSATPILGV